MEFPGSKHTVARGLVIQPAGKIVVAGQADGDLLLARFLPTGLLDSTFGSAHDGWVRKDMGGVDGATDVIQSFDGKSIVGGVSLTGAIGSPGTSSQVFAGFTADGLTNAGFGNGGKIFEDFNGGGKLANGPGRRYALAGGSGFRSARFLDAGANLVSIASFTPTATEANNKPASLIVFRSERLPFATRVFLTVSGTATPSIRALPGQADYTGLTAQLPVIGIFNGTSSPAVIPAAGAAYIDILPNETFAAIQITPVDDKRPEGDETAIITVANNPAYETASPSSVMVTILDNDSATLRDVADAYVRDGASANSNFGGATDLQVKNNTGGTTRQSFLKFDLSGINPASIGTVTLKLFGLLNNSNQKNVVTSVFGSDNTNWSETAITFNNKPAINTGVLASATIADATPRWYTLDVTAYVKAQKAAGHNVITLVLKNGATSDPFAAFSSREAGETGPQLTVAFA